jgi:hypothetical protein
MVYAKWVAETPRSTLRQVWQTTPLWREIYRSSSDVCLSCEGQFLACAFNRIFFMLGTEKQRSCVTKAEQSMKMKHLNA